MDAPFLEERTQVLIAGYVLGNLEPAEIEELEGLMERHPALLAEIDRQCLAMEAIGLSATPVKPPEALRSALVTDLRKWNSQSKVPFLAPWAWVAAAVLLFGVGLDSFLLRQRLQPAQEIVTILEQPNSRLFSLRGTGRAADASGSIVMDIDAQTAIVAIRGLPQLEEKKQYHLWAVVDGRKVFCGGFKPNGKSVLDRVALPSGLYSSVVSQLTVTAEVATATDHPTGQEVMISVL
jgi:anti-sigma-K factor RskA